MNSNDNHGTPSETGWLGPLAGIKVLDLTHVLAGPFLTQQLGDQGADIMKIECPGEGDETRGFGPHLRGESHYFLGLNRNKKSLVIDFKMEQGRDLLRQLATRADILVENYRPGLMEQLGLDYPTLAALNPRLIYCSVSGFGMSGPLRDKPSFDIVTQAMGGALSVNGEAGGNPVKIGLPLGDMVGGIFGSIGVLSALNERHQTGRGRLIDISLHDGMLGMLGYLAQLQLVSGIDPKPVGSSHPNIAPYGAFPASDGQIIIACLLQSFWARLCDTLGIPELEMDPRFATAPNRLAHRDELNHIISTITRTRSVSYWEKHLDAKGVPYAPVLGIGAALDHPQSLARNMVVEAEHATAGMVKMVGRPIKFPGEEQVALRAAPALGEHTVSVLMAELGLTAHDIDHLTAQGVIDRITPSKAERDATADTDSSGVGQMDQTGRQQ